MFGDFFQRVGNLVTGQGFINDDEERKKKQREQQAQQRKQQQAKQRVQPVQSMEPATRPNQAVQSNNSAQPNLNISKALETPKLTQQKAAQPVPQAVTDAEKQEKQRQVSAIVSGTNYKPQKNYLSKEEYDNAVKRRQELNSKINPNPVASTVNNVAGGIYDAVIKPAIVDPFNTLTKQVDVSVEARKRGDTGVINTGNADKLASQYDEDVRKGIITKEQAEEQKRKIYERARKNTEATRSAEKATGTKRSNEEGVGALLEFASNFVGGRVAKEGGAALAKPGEKVADEAVQSFKDMFKRNPTAQEEKTIREKVSQEAEKEAAQIYKPDAPQKPQQQLAETFNRADNTEAQAKQVATSANEAKATRAREIGERYGQTWNEIQNSSLSPQEKLKQQLAVKAESENLLKEIDTAANSVVDDAARQVNEAQAAREETVAQVAEQQQAARTPDPEQVVQASTPIENAEVGANNAYDEVENFSTKAYGEAVREKKDTQSQGFLDRVRSRIGRKIYDERFDIQRLDDKRAADAGIKKGDIDQIGSIRRLNSLASDTRQQVNATNSMKYNPVTLGDGSTGVVRSDGRTGTSVDDIVKRYKSNEDEWNAYRAYKRNVELVEAGQPNRLAIDRNGVKTEIPVAAQQAQVQAFERANPDALNDLAIMRHDMLQLVEKARKEVPGVISDDDYNAIRSYRYYTPWTDTKNNELAQMFVSGGMGGSGSTGKVVRSMTDGGLGMKDNSMDVYMQSKAAALRYIYKTREDRLVAEAGNKGLIKGFVMKQDPTIDAARKESLDSFRQLSEMFNGLRQQRAVLRADKKVGKAEISKVNAQITDTENRAVTAVRNFLRGTPDDAAGKVALDNPAIAQSVERNYARILKTKLDGNGNPIDQTKTMEQIVAETREQAIEVATRRGAGKDPASQAFQDVAPYADKMSRKDALDLFTVMQQYDNTGVLAFARQLEAKNKKLEGLTEGLQRNMNETANLREEMSIIGQGKQQAYDDFMSNQQAVETGTNQRTYIDESGGVGIYDPGELAAQYDALASQASKEGVTRFLEMLGTPFKIFWTGPLAVGFKLGNSLIRNRVIMFMNGEGLSGVGIRELSNEFRSGLGSRLVGNDYRLNQDLKANGMVQSTVLGRASRVGQDVGKTNLSKPFRLSREGWEEIGRMADYIENTQRFAIAKSKYQQLIRENIPHERALEIAAGEPDRIFGDLRNITGFARSLEAVFPYVGMAQAGTRALFRAASERPAEAALKASMLTGIFGVTLAYATQMRDEEGNSMIGDIIKDNQEYLIDNNLIIPVPGLTHKDEAGQWQGLIKIELPPDWRPLNRAVWQGVYGATQDDAREKGLTVEEAAMEMVNMLTGDMARSVVDKDSGVLGANPLNQMLKIVANRDPRSAWSSDKQLVSEDERLRAGNDPTAITRPSTSEAAVGISQFFGGKINPVQADSILGMMGLAGDIVQKGPADALTNNTLNRIFGKAGLTDKQREGKEYSETVNRLTEEILTDPDQRKRWQAYRAKKKDGAKDLLSPARRAYDYMVKNSDGTSSTSQVFEMDKAIDAANRAKGQPGNPLFDLNPQQLNAVLTYRSMRIPNAAKQNYSKGGMGAFEALGLDQAWYQEFSDNEQAFYKQVTEQAKQRKIAGGETPETVEAEYARKNEGKTFSGYKYPEMSEELRAVQNNYFKLRESDRAASTAYLNANPALKDYWALKEGFSDEERKALGFRMFDEDGMKYDDNGGYGGSRRGGYGGGSDYDPGDKNFLNRIGNTEVTQALKQPTLQDVVEILPLLRRTVAPTRGGRAQVPIGGRSAGNSPY